jgi:hypothetical protein
MQHTTQGGAESPLVEDSYSEPAEELVRQPLPWSLSWAIKVITWSVQSAVKTNMPTSADKVPKALKSCNILNACWVQGASCKVFVSELGYLGCEEIVHRDNSCMMQRPHSCLSVQKHSMLSPITQMSEVCLLSAGSELQGLCE